MYIIAEIGQGHDGSLGIAHSYIEALKNSGIDAVKFQTHIADAESSLHEPFRVKFSYQDKSRYDYWKRMEFSKPQWKKLKNHCEEVGFEFLSSPFSIKAFRLLEDIGVSKYKIGSGEVDNYLLLDFIGRTGKPVLLSSGMSTYEELEASINFLKPFGNEISILQCTTSYPTMPEHWGLNVLSELRSRFGLPVGFSDHSGDIFACLAATALGAEVIEFHVTFDKNMFGPDAKASIEISQVKNLVEGLRQIENSLSNPIDKHINGIDKELKKTFGKSLAVNKDLLLGHIISIEDLEAKKPAGYGIEPKLFNDIIGKTLKVNKSKYEFLSETDLKNE